MENILEKTIEKHKLEQILKQQESMLDDLLDYRNKLYSLSFSVGRKQTTYGNLSRYYIREPYVNLTHTIESTQKNIKKIEERIRFLESEDLSKI